eukprot:TRINITY_DN42130_c0_g1_i1.p1 TRINITY_DN42130_c0_g1~~TRINITY_DN42130_c0_g1_i1.p1  ORF type:complete len:455 (-),score=82.24 TRINITY_DN42130_c0_g1_i1:514-1695(-)
MDGPWAYRGNYYPDLFTLRRYGAMAPMKVHMDTGTYGRCLSASLHVGRQPASEGQGGDLEIYKCNGTCRQWRGWQAQGQEQPKEDLRDSEPLVTSSVVAYKPGRLAFFLSETPHGVSGVAEGGERDVLFVWFSCEATFRSGAVSSGHIQLVDHLLAARASVHDGDLHGQTPLMHAAISGHIPMIDYLMSKAANLEASDKRGLTPLHVASMWGKDGVVAQHLLDLGASARTETLKGDRPVDVATWAGHVTVIELLLSTNAGEAKRNPQQLAQTLAYAIRSGHHEVSKLLLEIGADVEMEDMSRQKPLFWAAWTGHTAIAELLLAKSADPNARSRQGEDGKHKALHMAITDGHSDMVELLLRSGASVDDKSNLIAIAGGHGAITDLLESYSAAEL